MLNLTAVNEETSSQPSWWGWRDALAVVARPIYLKRTLATALAVGTVLFAINQLNVVLDGHATAVVWVKTGVTYLVPFVVSNIGVLIATPWSVGPVRTCSPRRLSPTLKLRGRR